jgi:hypothetical protein
MYAVVKTIFRGKGTKPENGQFHSPLVPKHSTTHVRRVIMKQIVTIAFLVAMVALFVTPGVLFAGDTLVVYANGPTLDQVILGDTALNGSKLHHTYQLVSLDTTYIFDGTITTHENLAILGVPNPTTGKLPCIQPDVLLDNSIPGLLFTLNGQATKGTFKNLYLLGIAINNKVNYGGGQAIQVSGDSIRLVADNVVFEQWSQFAIGYSGNWDKFFITNCKFRNMTTQPNQWYVGEVLRNENYLGKFPTDSTVLRYNTMLCVSGYAAGPVTVKLVSYFEFSHNSVMYTFKNPFFAFNVTNAKFNDNIFYGAWSGGISKQEYPWWDQLWSPAIGSIIDFDALDSAKAAELLGHASTGAGDTAAEQLRHVEVKNNVYYWPAALTSFWTAWDDTAHTDSIYTVSWMNSRTMNMFTDKVTWPGFVESGNQNIDPGFGASIPGVLDSNGGNGVGLLNWFVAVRTGSGTTETYGYKLTQVSGAANWTPPWPLPESSDMIYSNVALHTGGTDGRPVGDPYWITGGPNSVEPKPDVLPKKFSLSAAYPNPFNPNTNIQYTLDKSGVVSLKVYNILGQLVRTVVDNVNQGPSTYTLSVDMSGFNSGVYIYILQQGSNRLVHKMTLLK